METSSNTLVSTVSAECTIDKYVFSVSSFSIELAINSLPFITLSLGGEAKLAGNARAVSPSRIFEEIKQLSAFQYKNVGGFKAKITPLSGGTPQSIEVNGWVVAGVGLTDLGASGKLAVQVTLMHPAAVLTSATVTRIPAMQEFGEFTAGKNTDGDTYAAVLAEATNFIGAFDLAFKAWNTFQRAGASITAGSDLDAMLTLNDTLQQRFATLIDYKGIPTFPMSRTGTEVGMAMLESFTNMQASTNIWNYMLSTALPTTGLVIQPTFDKPGLTAIPYNVWMQPSSAFSLEDISRVSMQPMDMNPLRGVLIHTNQLMPTGNSFYTVYADGELLQSQKLNDFAKLIDPKLEAGAVESIEIPWWMTKSESDPAKSDKALTYVVHAGADTKASMLTSYNLSMQRMSEFGGGISAAYIYERYKQSTGMSLLTPVMMANGTTPIYPGQRMGVAGTEFSFYVNQVKHVVDVAGRQAYSNWIGTHIRLGSGSFEDALYPKKHPYYLDV